MTTPSSTASQDWQAHLVEDEAGIARILARTHRVAVLGIKTPESGQPAFSVPQYAKRAGYAPRIVFAPPRFVFLQVLQMIARV